MKKKCICLFMTIAALFCFISCGDSVESTSKGVINVYTLNNSKALTGLSKTEFRLDSQDVSDVVFKVLKEEFRNETIKGLEFINVKRISGIYSTEITSLSDLIFDSALEFIGNNCFRTQEYLTMVEFKGENLPFISETAFPSNYKEEGKFFYPSDKENEYKKILAPFLEPEEEQEETSDTDSALFDKIENGRKK